MKLKIFFVLCFFTLLTSGQELSAQIVTIKGSIFIKSLTFIPELMNNEISPVRIHLLSEMQA